MFFVAVHVGEFRHDALLSGKKPDAGDGRLWHAQRTSASEEEIEGTPRNNLVTCFRPYSAHKFIFVSSDPQRFHEASTGFQHLGPNTSACAIGATAAPILIARTTALVAPPQACDEAYLAHGRAVSCTLTSHGSMIRYAALAVLLCLVGDPARAQSIAPLYRVFLDDGTALSSFGEWARVEDRLVFSMPLAPDAGPGDLHLVSVPVSRIDLARTERYADALRSAQYAATRGEADFTQLSGDVAQALNQVALTTDPAERLKLAERARQFLTDWPGAPYGYRVNEVRDIVGVLDQVIGSLRTPEGQGRFDLSLSTTTMPPSEPLLGTPDHADVVNQLMVVSNLASTPAEKVSLLQSLVALIDRAAGLLPEALARRIRVSAFGTIAEEERIDGLYARLRTATLARSARLAERAEVRGIERLRARVREQDQRLGARRPDDIAAVLATIDAHLDAGRRLRLAHDQWLLRHDRMSAYQRSTMRAVETLGQSAQSLEDIRLLAGPAPRQLRQVAQRLSRDGRRLALVQPPEELANVHAIFRSAYELAESAVQLRLDAAAAADVELATRASSAASGALMLLTRARADLEAAMRPPITPGTVTRLLHP